MNKIIESDIFASAMSIVLSKMMVSEVFIPDGALVDIDPQSKLVVHYDPNLCGVWVRLIKNEDLTGESSSSNLFSE